MKKILLLITALLTIGVSGAWALDVTIASNSAGNMPSAYGSFTGTQLFTTSAASGLSGLTISAASGVTIGEQIVNKVDDASYGRCFRLVTSNTSSYRITIAPPAGYFITGYTITGNANSSSYLHTLTSEGGTQKTFGTPYSHGQTNVTFNVSGIWEQSTYFDIQTSAGGNSLYIQEFTISLTKVYEEETPYIISFPRSGYSTFHFTSSGAADYSDSGTTPDYYNTNAGLYFIETNAADECIYIKEKTSGKYLHATTAALSSISADSPWTGAAAQTSTSLELATLPDGDKSEYQWLIQYAASGEYFIAPKTKPKTALAITSVNNRFVSLYNMTNGYGWAHVTLTKPSAIWLVRKQVAFADIVSEYGYTIEQIRAAILSISAPSTIDQIGYTTTTAYSTFTATVNAFTTSNTYSDVTTAQNTMYATVMYPTTGHYYITNLSLSGFYMLIDNANFPNSGNIPLLNEATSPKHLWKVAANGATPSVTSSIGNLIARSSSYQGGCTNSNVATFENINLETAYANNYAAAYGYFYFNDFHGTKQNTYTYAGTAYNSSTNPYGVVYWTSRQGSGNYWKFISADDDYDIYDVIIEDGLQLHPSLTCTLSGYAGNTVVYDGGFYAFAKGTAINESDFTPQSSDLEGYNTASTTVTIDTSGKTITVVYVPETSYTDLLTAFYTEHDLGAKLAKSANGTPGYPKTNTVSYTELKKIIDKGTGFTAEDYINIQTYYTELLAETDVNVPVDGNTYTFTNIQKGGSVKKYLYNNNGNLAVATLAENASIPESGRFVAHTLPNGKYFFVAKGTNYHFVIANGTSTDMSNGFSKEGYTPVEVLPMTGAATTQFDSGVTKEDVFGTVYFHGKRKSDGNTDGIIIINKGSDSFESIVTNPFYKTAYTSAFKIDRVSDVAKETYYNTVYLRQAGANSYASTYLPFAVQLPNGVKAYKASAPVANVMKMKKVADGDDNENNVLPALTAAVLYSDGATVTGNLTLTIVSSNLTAPADNALDGTLTDNKTVSETTYVLYGNASSAGFYPLNGTIAPTCKAYYDAGASSIKSFSFDFGDMEDAIRTAVLEERINEGTVYDLSGRRIAKPTQGIYIQNGKKFVIK